MIRDPDTGAVRFFGLYRGIVADNKDPIGKHRVRLQVPQVLNQAVTDWAYPLETAGVSSPTPLVGQGVWVQFEGGDPSYPVWTGTFGSSTTQLSLMLEQLADVSIVNPQDSSILSYNGTTKRWGSIASLPATSVTGTAVTQADTGTVTNTMLAHSGVTVNGVPAALGSSITISAIPYNNSVGTTHLLDGAVTTSKITDGNVTNAKITYPWVNVNGTQINLGNSAVITATPTAGSVTAASITAAGIPTTSITNFDSIIKSYKLDQFAAPTTNIGLNNTVLQNAGTPVSANDVATKGYTDALVAGLNYKKEVKATTTGSNIVLSGTTTLDGVTLNAGDRVLVRDQTDGTQNGLYVVDAGSWARSSDGTAMNAGTYVYVDQGVLYADAAFVLTTNDPITVGTTSLSFVQFSGAGQIIAGNGLSKTGNQLAVKGTASRISVSSGSVDIDSGYVGQTSITTVGTISTGTWNGTTIAVSKGGTGATSLAAGYIKGNGAAALTSVPTIPASDITGLPSPPILMQLAPGYVGPGPAYVTAVGTGLGAQSGPYEWVGAFDPTGNPVVRLEWQNGTYVITGHAAGNSVGGWRAIPLRTGWVPYGMRNGGTRYGGFSDAAFAVKTSTGIVSMQGLYVATNGAPATTPILQLPPDMRPDNLLIFQSNVSDSVGEVRIATDGTVTTNLAVSTGAWVDLSSIAFPAAGVATWTPLTQFLNGFADYANPVFGKASYWVDPYGVCWFNGLLYVGAAPGAQILKLPAGLTPVDNQHETLAGAGGFSAVRFSGSVQSGTSQGTLDYLTGPSVGNWISLNALTLVTPSGLSTVTPWAIDPTTNSVYQNGWVNFGATGSGNAPALVFKRPDGLVMSMGLMKSGTISSYAFGLPERMLPRASLLFQNVSNVARGRLDIIGNGIWDVNATYSRTVMPAQGSNVWFSLDGHKWYAGGC